ncbi:MAG: Ig-like domain-containing protein [Bacteroidota bacterium]
MFSNTYDLRSPTSLVMLMLVLCFSYGQNIAPTATNDSYFTPPDQELIIPASLGVLINDADPDGGSLFVHPVLVANPTSGTVSLGVDGSFSFDPVPDSFSPVTFQYRVCDDGNASHIVSQFNFDTPSLTSASVGPDATSINSNAAQAGCGIRMTTAGGSMGLDLLIPNTGGIFDFTGFEISFDYQDQESTADIVSGGNFRIYHISGNALGVRITVIDPDTGTSVQHTQNLGGFLPGNNNYVVTYDEVTGNITKSVNGAITVYPGVAKAFSPLDSSLSSDVTVGQFLDGGGNVIPSLCSMSISDKSSLCTIGTVSINSSTSILTNRNITYRVTAN